MLPTDLFFDFVSLDEASNVHALELSGYPSDEAASLEVLQYRLKEAPELFLGAYLPASITSDSENDKNRTLIGYVCATLSSSPKYTHDSIFKHERGINSASVCIHSVCVSKEYQNCGIATALLKEYISRLEKVNAKSGSEGSYARLVLIAHEELLGLYIGVGFNNLGLSETVHGSRPWYDLERTLNDADETSHDEVPTIAEDVLQTTMPPGVWEALQRGTRNRPNARSYSSFDDPYSLTMVSDGNVARTNKYDLLCPRAGCGSIILKSNVGQYIEGPVVVLEPANHPPVHPLPPVSGISQMTHWWLIKPSPFAFENIGFSKAVPSEISSTGPRKKFLICAECDLGPLGWCIEGGTEFWLACDRVGYRV